MTWLVAAHLVAALLAPTLVRLLGTRAFLVLAAVPLVSFGWVAAQTSSVGDGEVLTETFSWVPSLGMEVAFAMGTLQWTLALVVTGVGALVLGYCTWYFDADEPGLGTFAGSFIAFAGTMLGLVLAADLLLLYVFWELTTILSFLLIGHDPAKRASRAAGMKALLVTTLGGLAMLVGVLMLGAQAGTYRILELLDDPPSGAMTVTAVLLLLAGAATKSALVPFHFWLPGAMAAPTPVSAYLHAAAMVKAGVYLVALLVPAFAGVAGWRETLLVLGVVTMVVGGWQALRQTDIKLLLAYGTVSQLGFLLVVAGVGTRSAALAALGMLVAHALFKAALFLTVGIVDHSTGTRDLRELSGVGRAMPLVAASAALAAASMAGVPPFFGFVAKESVLTALVDVAEAGEGTGLGAPAGWLLVAGVVLGSVLTVAYAARFLWGAFATKPGVVPTRVHRPAAGLVAPPAVLAALSLALGFAGAAATDVVLPYAEQLPAGVHEPELALWHGFGTPLLLSAVTLTVGLLLFVGRKALGRFQRAATLPVSAERGYEWSMRALDRAAVEVTGKTQRGSVAIYLAVILLVVVLVPGGALVAARAEPLGVVWWDTPAQAVVGALVVLGALLTTRARRRLKAVVLASTTGYGTAVLFLLHGAPDLALTQVLVETVTIVIFVLVMRRLPEYFTDRPLQRSRYWRMALGVAVAGAVAGFMLLSTGARTADPVSSEFAEEAVAFGGGRNIVNVTLVDIRAWDTMGELAVLVAAATGVASLIFLDTRGTSIRRVFDIPYPASVRKQPTTRGRRVWLPGGRTLAPEKRSIMFEVVTRLLFHTIVLFSLFLLFSGHNNPGGGFAAGLVTGLALLVRYLAGGRYELDEAAPIDAGVLVGSGLFIATGSGLVPLAFGGTVLQSAVLDLHVPVLGDVHLVTSVFFDVGVYLVVVGLLLDLLRSLGSGIDRHILREERTAVERVGGGA
ncbi:MAG TPA: Na+/H+ antiporter subunit A [Marmoricola sp.]|nr:Na+/H+ antiporter subunit A [Marmoricola sp.]